jgi:hypothetical protein
MNPSGTMWWGVVVGLAIVGNIAGGWAQTRNEAQTQTAQSTLSDQVRQQVLHPNMPPGSIMPMNLPMEGMFGSRVTPMMFLSVEDVRHYLTSQLERLHNRRLKLGDVKADDANITADVVTVDNSLVQRLSVDRRTGVIKYED